MIRRWLALVFLALPLSAGDWPLLRGNLYYTGNNDDAAPSGQKTLFVVGADSAIQNPFVVDGLIHFTTEKGWLYLVDEETGDLRVKRRVQSNALRPVIVVGNLVVQCGEGSIECWNRLNGRPRWRRKAPGELRSGLLAADSSTIYLFTKNAFALLRLDDGKELIPPIPFDPRADFPVPYGSSVYGVGREATSNALVCFNKTNGDVAWKQGLPADDHVSAPIIWGDRSLVVSGSNVYAFALSNGEPLFQSSIPGNAEEQPSLSGEGVLAVPLVGSGFALCDGKSGALLRTIAVSNRIPGALALVGDGIYAATAENPSNGATGGSSRILGWSLASGSNLFRYDCPAGLVPASFSVSSGRLLAAFESALYSVGVEGSDRPARLDFSAEPAPRVRILTNVTSSASNQVLIYTNVLTNVATQVTNLVTPYRLALTNVTEQPKSRFFPAQLATNIKVEPKTVIRPAYLVTNTAKNNSKQLSYNFYDTLNLDKIVKMPPVTNHFTNYITNITVTAPAYTNFYTNFLTNITRLNLATTNEVTRYLTNVTPQVNVQTNVLTLYATNFTRTNIPVDALVLPAKPRPEMPMLTLKLLVRDRETNAVEAKVEMLTRLGRKILDRGAFAPGDDLTAIKIPRSGDSEFVGSADEHLDNKLVIRASEKTSATLERTLILSRIEKGKSIVVENILFEYNQATLLPESAAILDRIRDTLLKSDKLVVEVRGFTDATGEAEYNRKLSLRRANSVRDYLIKKGVPQGQLLASGLGSENPIADNKTEAGRAKNRRTEFFIVKY